MSKIEWTDKTWNPVTGCTKVSPGCKNCYAATMAKRLQAMEKPKYKNGFAVTCHPESLGEPLKWRKPCKIFVCSMGDLFHEDVPFRFIDDVFYAIQACPNHTFQILTKRAERMFEYFKEFGPSLPNVWLGVTAENQEQADKRIPLLLQTPAAVRFVSIEPMLGGVKLDKAWLTGYNTGNESENEREDSLPDGFSGRTENRSERSNMAIKSSESVQVDRGDKSIEMQAPKSRKRHGEILPDTNDGKREEIPRSGSSVDMVSLERSHTGKHDHKSHKRELKGQSSKKPGISNISRSGDAFDKISRSNFQEGQTRQISWVIVGGESGSGARPMHPDWARDVIRQCKEAGVPVFFKQWGEWESKILAGNSFELANLKGNQSIAKGAEPNTMILFTRVGKKKAGSLLDGKEYKEFPLRQAQDRQRAEEGAG